MGASQVEYNMCGAGARCSQVGTFPNSPVISAEIFHFGEFLRLRNFLGNRESRGLGGLRGFGGVWGGLRGF